MYLLEKYMVMKLISIMESGMNTDVQNVVFTNGVIESEQTTILQVRQVGIIQEGDH